MKKKILWVTLGLIILSAIGIGVFFIWRLKSSPTQPKQSEPESGFQFIKETEIAKGHQVRMLFINNRFYVFYKKPDKKIAIKTLDINLNPEGEEIFLKNVIGPDYKVVFLNNHFYLSDANYLRKYDLNWNEVKSIPYFNELPSEISKLWPHGVDDMILSTGDGSIYLGIAVGNAPPESIKKKGEKKPDLADNLYLEEFDSELNLKNKAMLKDVGNVPSLSLIEENDELIVITGDRHWDDSSLIILRYDKNFKFLERKIISEEAEANEEFPMTMFFKDGVYYIGYRRITGDISQPTTGEPIISSEIIIKAYDTKWDLLGRLPKESNNQDSISQDITGWFDFVLVGDKIYLVFDSKQDKIILKEFLIKI